MFQRARDDAPLQLAMERDPEMVPHHERHKQGARRLDLLRHVQGNRDGDRRNVLTFYGALNQRDRLVSYRSRGAQ